MEPCQGKAYQARREDFTQQSIATHLPLHYLSEVHKLVKGVLDTIVHLELRQSEERRGNLVQYGVDK